MTVEEITDIIYDTLMQNTQHPQFEVDKVDNQGVDNYFGFITFDYDDVSVSINIGTRKS